MRVKNNVDKYKFRNYFYSKYQAFFRKYNNSDFNKYIIEIRLD